MKGFRLKVQKGCLISLSLQEMIKNTNRLKKKPLSISLCCPDNDGVAFDRCLNSLREGDIIEVKFVPFLPREGS